MAELRARPANLKRSRERSGQSAAHSRGTQICLDPVAVSGWHDSAYMPATARELVLGGRGIHSVVGGRPEDRNPRGMKLTYEGR